MAAIETGSLRARGVVEHGRTIWVYKNVRTHQVVYSLQEKLRGRNHTLAMKQLPFLGKKTKPAMIREDMWRPYCRIRFGKEKEWIGQLAYRKLREYSSLRYFAWDRKAQNLSGDREERAVQLMDQRATSVADIANVLKQIRLWAPKEWKVENTQDKQLNMELDALWTKSQMQSKHAPKALQRLEEEIADRVQQIQEAGLQPETRLELRQEIARMQKTRNAHRQSILAVNKINDIRNPSELVTEAMTWPMARKASRLGKREAKTALATLRQERRSDPRKAIPLEQKYEAMIGRALEQPPPAAVEAAVIGAKQEAIKSIQSAKQKRPWPGKAPISIAWDDLRDAEWAAAWPTNVVHEPLGFMISGRQFPTLESRPITDLTPEEEEIMDQTRLDGEASEEGAGEGELTEVERAEIEEERRQKEKVEEGKEEEAEEKKKEAKEEQKEAASRSLMPSLRGLLRRGEKTESHP